MPGTVDFTLRDHVGWLRFDNPGKRNAMTIEMWRSMSHLLRTAADEPALRVLVLTGAGEDAFVSGSDISTFGERRSTPEAAATYAAAVSNALTDLARFPKPSLAAIRGFCLGGGLSIAAAADLRLASDGASFAIPAGRLGIGYSADQIGRLRELVGPAFAFQLVYLGERVSADQAALRGLVNTIVPAADFDAQLARWTDAMVANAPLTLAAAKRVMVAIGPSAREGDMDVATAAIAACMASADYREGQRAFAEKRRPVFSGS